ncbi:hypothetical protein TRVL_09647 [Trypanosoma vivax]|nr:hypothetical protein TRVL_09647 [Trypanosoma vivax]
MCSGALRAREDVLQFTLMLTAASLNTTSKLTRERAALWSCPCCESFPRHWQSPLFNVPRSTHNASCTGQNSSASFEFPEPVLLPTAFHSIATSKTFEETKPENIPPALPTQ